MRRLTAILMSCGLLPASLVGQESGEPLVLRLETQLVVRTVEVRDRDGLAIEGLTPGDFVVTEDGVPQTISVFEFHRIDNTVLPSPVGSGEVPVSVDSVDLNREAPSEHQYTDRRLLAFYFDLTGMSGPEKTRTFSAARKFVTDEMRASDLVAIFAYSGGAVARLREFTADRGDLLAALRGLAQDLYPDIADGFDIFAADRRLIALQSAARALGRINQAKSLIYFSNGVSLGINNQAQLRATLNDAVRANVSIFPIDSRGLAAFAPIGNADRASPGGIAAYTTSSTMSVLNAFQQTQDALYTLAADTGGMAFLDSNDLVAGIAAAQHATSGYYVIGYYPTNRSEDGRLRRVDIDLSTRSGNLSYQDSYYAHKDFSQYTAADRERQLEEALLLGDPVTDLTVVGQASYFRATESEYFVPVSLRIAGNELLLTEEAGAESTRIDFVGEIRGVAGAVVTRLRDHVDIGLGEDVGVPPLASRPVQYDTAFRLQPGRYTLRFVVRNSGTGRMGAYQSPLVVPDLEDATTRLPVSSVVMGNQRTDVDEVLYNADGPRGSAGVAHSPLLDEDGYQLVPAINRTFSRRKPLYVYLEAYTRTVEGNGGAVAFITLHRGQERVYESPAFAAGLPTDRAPGALPFRITIPPGRLPTGEFTFQMSILHPEGQDFAFWQTRVQITP